MNLLPKIKCYAVLWRNILLTLVFEKRLNRWVSRESRRLFYYLQYILLTS